MTINYPRSYIFQIQLQYTLLSIIKIYIYISNNISKQYKHSYNSYTHRIGPGNMGYGQPSVCNKGSFCMQKISVYILVQNFNCHRDVPINRFSFYRCHLKRLLFCAHNGYCFWPNVISNMIYDFNIIKALQTLTLIFIHTHTCSNIDNNILMAMMMMMVLYMVFYTIIKYRSRTIKALYMDFV